MELKKSIFIGFAVLLCGTSVYGQFTSPWTYVCRNKFCVKVDKDNITEAEQPGNSMTVCKLKCADDANLWPLPTGNVSLGKTMTPFTLTKLNFVAHPTLQAWLSEVQNVFKANLEKMNNMASSGSEVNAAADNIVNVTFAIVSDNRALTLDTDESYSINITYANETENLVRVTVAIQAATYFGARHGLETLSQLVAYDEDSSFYQILNTVEIADKPVFAYRGMHLDTSRNFIPIDQLKSTVDAMSYNKLNMFHIHLTDTHSYPLESLREPRLTQYGAYSSKKVYTIQEMKDLKDYAKRRGVKLVAEFDAPAHVGNGWQWGEKNGTGRLVVCENQEPWYDYCVEPPCGQLNLGNLDNVTKVLESVYDDYMEIFDRDLFHMGGDEVHLGCYNTSVEVTSYMEQQGIPRTEEGFLQLWNVFQTRAYELAKKASGDNNLTAMLWTSHITNQKYGPQYINKANYIIQTWDKSDDEIIPFLIDNGYRTIFSNYDTMYLDCGYQAWIGNGHNWCSPYKGWQTIYDHSPFKIYAATAGEEAAQKAIDDKIILGGETPLWSEQTDGNTFEGKLWPRGSALAERLWTNPTTTWLEAERRMVDHRQRIVERGIHADRLQPEWCYQNENQCPGPPTTVETTTPQPNGANSLSLTPIYITVGLIYAFGIWN